MIDLNDIGLFEVSTLVVVLMLGAFVAAMCFDVNTFVDRCMGYGISEAKCEVIQYSGEFRESLLLDEMNRLESK